MYTHSFRLECKVNQQAGAQHSLVCSALACVRHTHTWRPRVPYALSKRLRGLDLRPVRARRRRGARPIVNVYKVYSRKIFFQPPNLYLHAERTANKCHAML